jgi:hypothetical protein
MAALPPFSPMNMELGIDSRGASLLSLLSKNLVSNNTITLGAPGDSRSTATLLDEGNVFQAATPVYIRGETTFAELITQGNIDLLGNIIIGGDLYVTGRVLVQNYNNEVYAFSTIKDVTIASIIFAPVYSDIEGDFLALGQNGATDPNATLTKFLGGSIIYQDPDGNPLVEIAGTNAAVAVNNNLWGGGAGVGLQVENTSTGYALRTENTADGSSFVNYGTSALAPPSVNTKTLEIEADSDDTTGALFVERTDGTPLDNSINAVLINGSVFALRGFAAFTTIISDTSSGNWNAGLPFAPGGTQIDTYGNPIYASVYNLTDTTVALAGPFELALERAIFVGQRLQVQNGTAQNMVLNNSGDLSIGANLVGTFPPPGFTVLTAQYIEYIAVQVGPFIRWVAINPNTT